MLGNGINLLGAIVLALIASCYAVKSFSLETNVEGSPDRVLQRAKREVGFAINHTDTLTVESIQPSTAATALKVGSQINFKIHSWWPKGTNEIEIAISMPTAPDTGTGLYPLFHLSEVKFNSIGSNFKMDPVQTSEMFQYLSVNDSGQYNEAVFSLKNMSNIENYGETQGDGDSEFSLNFYGVVSGRAEVTANSNFFVLAGIHYGTSESVWVARSAFTVTEVGPGSVTELGSIKFIESQQAILLDTHGYSVFTVEFLIKKLYEEIVFEVHGGIVGQPNILEIIDVKLDHEQGDSYEYVRGGKKIEIGNSGSYNNATRLEAGLVTNRLMKSSTNNDANSVVRLLAIGKLPPNANVGDNYTIGVGVQTVNEIYTTIGYTIATAEATLPHIYKPPEVNIYTTQKLVYEKSYMSVFANITFFKNTMARFSGFLQLPNNSIIAKVVAVRVLGIGSDLKYSPLQSMTYTFNSSDGNAYNDQVYFNIGYIFSSGFDSNKLWRNQLALECEFYIVSGSVGAIEEIGFGVSSDQAVSVMAINITIEAKSSAPSLKANLTTATYMEDKISEGQNQLAYLDVQYPASHSSIEPVTVETPHPYFAITKIEVDTVGKHIRDALYEYHSHSKLSGSLYERMDVYPKTFVTNIGRYDPPKWDEVDHTVRFKVHLTLVKALDDFTGNLTVATKVGSSPTVSNFVSFNYSINMDKKLGDNAALASSTKVPDSSVQLTPGDIFYSKMIVDIPPQSFDTYLATSTSSDQSMDICTILLKSDSFVSPLPPYRTMGILDNFDATTKKASNAKMEINMLTNFESNGSAPAKLELLFAAQVSEHASAGQIVNAAFNLKSETLDKTETETYTVAPVTTPPAIGTLNFTMTMPNGTDSLAVKGFHRVLLTINTMPNTKFYYTIKFIDPVAQVGQLNLANAKIVKSGYNLPCLDHRTIVVTENETVHDKIVPQIDVKVGWVTNIGLSDNWEDNTFSAEVYVQPTDKTSEPARVVEAEILVGSETFKTSVTLNTVSTFQLTNYEPNITMKELNKTIIKIQEHLPVYFDIYCSESIANLRMTVTHPTIAGTPHPIYPLSVINPHIAYCGSNYVCKPMKETEIQNTFDTNFQTLIKEFKILQVPLSNTGQSKRDSRTAHMGPEDLYTLGFIVAGNDIDELDVRSFNVEFTWDRYTSGTETKSFTFAPNVTIIEGDSKPQLQAIPYIKEIPEPFLPGTSVTLNIQLNHTAESTSTAYFVTAAVYLPYYIRFDNYVGFTGKEPATKTYEINRKAYVVTYDNIRSYENCSISLAVTVDPDKKLDPTKIHSMNIPAHIEYHFSNRSLPDHPGKHLRYIYGPSQTTLLFEFKSNDKLGMEDGTIKDCQIGLANSGRGYVPASVRLSNSTGWVSDYRKYYKDYFAVLNVDFNDKVVLSGVTFGTAKFGDNITMVKTFDMTISFNGVDFEPVKINNYVANFSLTYINGIAHLKFPMKIATRFLKIFVRDSHTPVFTPKVGFKIEFHGFRISNNTERDCPPTRIESPHYSQRSFLVAPGTEMVYICATFMTSDFSSMGSCYLTVNKGGKWIKLDLAIASINFMTSDKELYGVAKNRLSYLKSPDKGATWLGITEAEYVSKKDMAGNTFSTHVPFIANIEPDDGAFKVTSGSNEFSASNDGLVTKTGADPWKLYLKWVQK